MKNVLKYVFILVFCIVTLVLVISNPWNVFATDFPFNGMIDADSLVIRKSASSSSETVTELVFGSKVTVTGESGSFYKVSFDKDKVGYASKTYVKNINDYASTSGEYRTYCDSLIEKGFVESYCPQLYYLHVAYPNWNFTPDITNLTLEEASKKEEDKTVLQTGNSNYYLRDKPIEKNYYYIKANVIASFMDPRNTMIPNRIFQFLDLQSSKDIVNDAAMAKIAGSGNLKNYFNEFKQAGIDNKINPLHVLARSAQEGANTSTYSAVTGLYTTTKGLTSSQGFSLDGYYNFYNIGSYVSGYYTGTVQRGLAYAAGFLEDDKCFTKNEETGLSYYDNTKCGDLSYQRPWNSQAKAISGGAEFIANGYVRKGQDTLYYQKFNVASYHNYTLYTHQYMTNVMAPNSEGEKLYNAYKAGGLLNSNFNFIIPVYKDLAEEIAQPVDKNGDASLKEIKVNDELVTGFDSDVLEYPFSVKTNEESVNVTAIPNNPLTKVEGTGKYTFVDGEVQIVVKTTAEDGTNMEYKVLLKQVIVENEIKVEDVTNRLKVKIDNNYMYGISPGMTAQELINSINSAEGVGVLTNSSGEKKTSGNLATGDIITIEGSLESKSFTVVIRGDINGDSSINLKDFVLVQSHILKKGNLANAKFYAGDVNYDNAVNLKDFVLVQSHILKKLSL